MFIGFDARIEVRVSKFDVRKLSFLISFRKSIHDLRNRMVRLGSPSLSEVEGNEYRYRQTNFEDFSLIPLIFSNP